MGRNGGSEGLSPVEDVGDLGYPSTRGSGFPFKRSRALGTDDGDQRVDRRSSRLHRRGGRKGFPVKGKSILYIFLLFAVLAYLVMQSSMMAGFRPGGGERLKDGKMLRKCLKFAPLSIWKSSRRRESLEHFQLERSSGTREPRLAFVVGSMKKDSSSLLLLTVVKRLQQIGYRSTIFAIEHGEVYSLWEQIGCELSILGSGGSSHVDWSLFEGVILSSLEAKTTISSLIQEPFSSIPVIWAVFEDTLGKRLMLYGELGWHRLIDEWKTAFHRANVVVFPDFSLPMLYNMLDTGNFFVISGTPADVWAADRFARFHSKNQVRVDNGFLDDDLIIVVVGSSLFYNELPWDYTVAMHTIGHFLMKLKRAQDHQGGSFKFVFLCGNSTDVYDETLQEVSLRLGLPNDSVKHYSMDSDVNSVLLMADIVLYGSFQDEQGFPSLLTRAMFFEKPIIAPDLSIIKKYIVDGVHGLIFRARNLESLTRSFSLLVSGMKLSKFANVIATSGKLLARDMLSSNCITGYVKLLENVLEFPSECLLPRPVDELKQQTWEWSLFSQETELMDIKAARDTSSVLEALEREYAGKDHIISNSTEIGTDSLELDILTPLDWDVMKGMENSEELENLESEEHNERTERTLGSWDEIYRAVKKSEKIKFESNEKDEGELERIGQSLCIYEIYGGQGAWPFLHHGSLYRGLSLSTTARRSRSDDVDAVSRLQLLNDSYYRDRLCEIGGMFSIAKMVDNIHRTPWIGFQSWQAGGRNVSLSGKAEYVLENTLQVDTKGDVVYFWVSADIGRRTEQNAKHDFWSFCDILNAGRCSELFEMGFRLMYNIPPEIDALPPMPNDGGYWSTLHSWAMPTPSFLEFVMFSRMFVDAIDTLHHNFSNINRCLLGSLKQERRHCYCRILELLVNIWAYHSGRKMVYINPVSGFLEEQHPLQQREEVMWVKYFNYTLLKSMDEDLAEEADDGDHLNERWLWPLTGEVYWQGINDREREERYRQKMDKKKKTKEKLLERLKYGYKQRTLGGA
ncbi:hypothetical protein H6P81_017598 [Aristolochia fimbriata]|uniref:Glycosyl transferase family 1 domain-containing protein n=1 Tax=Aristolochia fimbriata TaxID=158543 RepID=A0AAV7E0D9_ARIFI|nr:hypothetical protein H6P81_017598 [Aristolochia fimbriata]